MPAGIEPWVGSFDAWRGKEPSSKSDWYRSWILPSVCSCSVDKLWVERRKQRERSFNSEAELCLGEEEISSLLLVRDAPDNEDTAITDQQDYKHDFLELVWCYQSYLHSLGLATGKPSFEYVCFP